MRLKRQARKKGRKEERKKNIELNSERAIAHDGELF
jgi:hypothetical protein